MLNFSVGAYDISTKLSWEVICAIFVILRYDKGMRLCIWAETQPAGYIFIIVNEFIFEVVLEEHMFGYNGFDLLDPKILDDIPRLEVEKKMSIADLYALFAKEFVSVFPSLWF